MMETGIIILPLGLVGGVGSMEMILVLVIALMLFGGKGLPNIAKGVGRAMREFKRATSEVEVELKRAIEEEPVKRAPRPRVDLAKREGKARGVDADAEAEAKARKEEEEREG